MSIAKKISLCCSVVLITAIGGYGIHQWVAKQELNAATILFLLLSVGFLFHTLAWEEMRESSEKEKDLREQQSIIVSSRISYYVLLFSLIIVLFATEGITPLDEMKNIPLVMAIGLTFAIQPIAEFIAKRVTL